MVRRGGMHVFKHLLSSMGYELFSLAPDAMKGIHFCLLLIYCIIYFIVIIIDEAEIYRRLKITETYDKDELCQVNARALLGLIDDIMQAHFTSSTPAGDINSLVGSLLIQELN